MDEDVRRYLADLVATAGEVLGAGLMGAYAAGSVALNAYRPGHSDVDVALVCANTLAPAPRRELVARVRHEALPCPARGLELVVYSRAAARSGTPDPGFEVEVNTGARMPFRASYAVDDRPAADGLFWYGLDRSILHQSGLALLGPPAADTFAELDPADLRRLLAEASRWWLARSAPADGGALGDGGAEDAVLGACRALVKIRHGVWMSKTGAARRLLDDGHPAAVVAAALVARAGGPPLVPGAARAFEREVLTELESGPGSR